MISCVALIVLIIVLRLINKQALGVLAAFVLLFQAYNLSLNEEENAICVFLIIVAFSLMLYLLVSDAKTKGNNSVFCKYNMFVPGNKLPKWLVFWLGILASLCSAVQVVHLLFFRD